MMLALLPGACGKGPTSSSTGGGGGTPFESATPGVSRPAATAGTGGGKSGTGGGSSIQAAIVDSGLEPADIIESEDDRLYVLNRHGGLTVLDTSEKSAPRILSSEHAIDAMPRKLYVRNGIVVVVSVNDRNTLFDKTTGQWQLLPTETLVRALDARSPGSLRTIAELVVPGQFLDSRLAGNILYVAATERFPSTYRRTSIASFDVRDPSDTRKVDELVVESTTGVSFFSEQRAYFAAASAYDSTSKVPIKVVDISDPSGLLHDGTTIQAAGPVHRMDEHDGVLRVFSQPYTWSGVPPTIETFAIQSSTEISGLGSAELGVLDSGYLVAEYFDGPRAYALTEQISEHPAPPRTSIFTVDLGDPEHPKQGRTLAISGQAERLEPRGDRLIALGFEQSSLAGVLSVSLYDVANLATPSLLSRVRFDQPWSANDADSRRIRASLSVLDADGLIVTSFEDLRTDAAAGCLSRAAELQLIDWSGNTLKARGSAAVKGRIGPALLQGTQLFAAGDQYLNAFDIGDRDQPLRTARQPLAQTVNQTLVVGESKVVRLNQDAATGVTELDVASPERAASPGKSRLEIEGLPGACASDSWLVRALAGEDQAYLVYANRADASGAVTRIVTVDVSNGDAPRVLADAAFGFGAGTGYRKPRAQVDSGSVAVSTGSTLAFLDRDAEPNPDGTASIVHSAVQVVDLSHPETPSLAKVDLPASLGVSGLVVDGQIVATSHFEASSSDAARVRFYLDRVDVSNASEPKLLPPINIPGSLLSFDRAASRALTVGYELKDIDWSLGRVCNEAFVYPHLDPSTQQCQGTVQSLYLVSIEGEKATLLASLSLGNQESIAATARGDNLVFLRLFSGAAYLENALCETCLNHWTTNIGNRLPVLLVLGGTSTGELSSSRLELDDGERLLGPPIAARHRHAALWSGLGGTLLVVDATQVDAPRIVRSLQTDIVTAQDVQMVNGLAIASLGPDGVVTIPLDE